MKYKFYDKVISIKFEWKFSWNLNEITVEISIKFQPKSIGNTVYTQKKFQWNANGNPVEILMQYLS